MTPLERLPLPSTPPSHCITTSVENTRSSPIPPLSRGIEAALVGSIGAIGQGAIYPGIVCAQDTTGFLHRLLRYIRRWQVGHRAPFFPFAWLMKPWSRRFSQALMDVYQPEAESACGSIASTLEEAVELALAGPGRLPGFRPAPL